MIPVGMRYNAENVRYNATPWLTGDGSTSSGTLLDRHGNPISSGKLKRVDAIHRFDWQGRQLLYATARTNAALWSEDFTNAWWTKTAGGTGTTPIVTANYATAPNGTVTADRMQFSIGAGATSGDLAQLAGTNITTTVGAVYASLIWTKTNDGSTVGMSFVDPAGVTRLIMVTPTWQLFASTAVALVSSSIPIRLRLRGNELTAKTADISVWGGQFVPGSVAGSYIPTTSAPVTLTDYTLTGPSVALGQVPDVGAVLDWDGVAKR